MLEPAPIPRVPSRVGLWLALALFGCSGHEPAHQPSASIDLLALLEEADVWLSDPERITGPLGPAEARNRILTDEMDGASATRWWPESSRAGGRPVSFARIEGESVLALRSTDPPLAMLLPSASTDVYRVRVRWRADSPGRGALVVRGLLGAPSRFDDTGQARELARQEARGLASSVARVALSSGRGWQESELQISQESGRQSMLLRLLSTDGTVHVDRVEVRRLTPLEAFVQLSEVKPDSSPLHRRLQMPYETSECLLLPTGSKVSYRVVVPPRRPRLDTQIRVLGGSPETAEFVVRIDGELRARRSGDRRADQEGDPWQVPLDHYAGKRVELELSLHGSKGAVGIMTAPRLLGSGDARPAVVLVSLDTLRADHLGAYGDPRRLTPNIDRLASEGTVFERVVSPASYTLPTHVTVLTGQHPLVHGVRRLNDRIDPGRSETLPELLQTKGYATAGFTGGGYVNPVFGFSRGFEQYSTRDPAAWEEAAIGRSPMARVIDWMDRYRDQPYFLFVHTYLVHGYLPRQRYLDRVAPESGIDLDEAYENPRRLPIHRRFKYLIERAEGGDETAAEALRTLYAATVAQADEEVVGALLEAVVRRAAAGGATILALLSDHGEELLEHGELGHGGALWGELVDVPWILRGPGVEVGRRWPHPVGLVDVTPTILRLLGLSVPDSQTGRDRLEPGASIEPGNLVLHHELESGARWDGVVAPRWKLLRHQHGAALDWYLFDLESDPGETINRVETHPDVFAGMRARLQERSRRLLATSRPGSSSRSEEAELPESLVRELRALGYVDR